MTIEPYPHSENKFLQGLGAYIALALICGAVGWAFLIGMDREVARREAQTQANCQHYGAEMNQWAAERGLEQPCQ